MKLSKAQQHVIDRMRDGWELGIMTDYSGRCWLQQGGIGRGGQSENVSTATVWVLRRMDLIVLEKHHFPMMRAHLKEPTIP